MTCTIVERQRNALQSWQTKLRIWSHTFRCTRVFTTEAQRTQRGSGERQCDNRAPDDRAFTTCHSRSARHGGAFAHVSHCARGRCARRAALPARRTVRRLRCRRFRRAHRPGARKNGAGTAHVSGDVGRGVQCAVDAGSDLRSPARARSRRRVRPHATHPRARRRRVPARRLE